MRSITIKISEELAHRLEDTDKDAQSHEKVVNMVREELKKNPLETSRDDKHLADPADLVTFLKYASDIKGIKRRGWVLRGIESGETVACHMYRMAFMAMLLAPPHLDRDRCTRMALVHDLAECIVGDITPQCGIGREEKHTMEKEAMIKIVSPIAGTLNAQEIFDLWQEYEENATDESRYVHSLDKLEFALQAYEYESKYNERWDDFFYNANNRITDPHLRMIFEYILQQRQA